MYIGPLLGFIYVYMSLYIEIFYPPISLDLCNKALQFAKGLCKTTDEEISIILQGGKTLLLNNNKKWVKNYGNKDFDAPMGCFNGAEAFKTVGTCILSKISNEINKRQVGRYRGDGLDLLRNMPRSKMDRKRKDLIEIFQECDLSLVCKINLTNVDFLDIRFGMKQEIYTPYRKLNNDPIYIHKQNIRIIHKIYLEICQSTSLKESKTLFK